MNRKDIQDRIRAILEDMYGHKVEPVWRDSIEGFFDNENDYGGFLVAVELEFEVGYLLVESCNTFYELVILIEDELSSENI